MPDTNNQEYNFNKQAFLGDTPVVFLDLDRVEKNLIRAQTYFNLHKIQNRPHIKTHKSLAFAKRQIELGAVGITCQKLGEAEVMANGGIKDILITYPIVSQKKIDRLMALNNQIKITTVVDNFDVAKILSDAAKIAGKQLRVLIECDTGGERCGVQSPETASALANSIASLPGLIFGGLMTYPPKGQVGNTAEYLNKAIGLMKENGIEVELVSIGGTPDMYKAHEIKLSSLNTIQEHRPGTYLFNDRYMLENKVGPIEDCAMQIAVTVISRPTENRAIIDAGSKTFSSDFMGFSDHGIILEYPDARIEKLSEEHGHVNLSNCTKKPAIGEILTIIPNHACAVSNLTDYFVGVKVKESAINIRVDARGKTS
jgi:D-serine deaminase-like pyridoxal phosphate-dependent protein